MDIKDLNEEAQAKLKSISIKEMAQELDLGQETLKDIIADLLKPGRDSVILLMLQSYVRMFWISRT